jgi:hypothetical protein
MMKIKNPKLLKQYSLENNVVINGLERYSCEACIYTNSNTFYIPAPKFLVDESCDVWDMGFLDVRNVLFYELGCLVKNECDKDVFFYEWIAMLQRIIDGKIYAKLFEVFGFDKGSLVLGDRQLYEPTFFQVFRNLLGENLSAEFLIYICDLFKRNGKMISYTVFKRKIVANLKNFKEVKDMKLTSSINSLNKQ